jgi:hypothetical protein
MNKDRKKRRLEADSDGDSGSEGEQRARPAPRAKRASPGGAPATTAAAPYAYPTEDDCGAAPPKPGSIACLDAKDALPKEGSVQFWVEIDSPAFLRRGVLVARPMLENMTLWFSDNTALHAKAKEEEARTGVPCTISQFAGIGIDSMDNSHTAMTIFRMRLPPSCIHLCRETGSDTPAPEEVGVTVSAKTLLETLQGVKEYQSMIIYSEWGSNVLSVQVVSSAHDSTVTDIPMLATNAEHQTVSNWDMRYDLSMSLSEFKDTIKRAANLDSDNICFEIKRWKEQGLIFVMSADSRTGALFRAFQVTYVTPLKRNPSAEVCHALEKLNSARALQAASDKHSRAADALQANVDEAERELKQHLQVLYDTMAVPAGFDRPPRASTLETPLGEYEAEVRGLLTAIHQHQKSTGQPLINIADYTQNLDAMSVVEVATSFVDDIRTAPFLKKDVMALKSEYKAHFSVARLQTMLKTPQSSEVQLHLPKDTWKPISVRLDIGGTTDGSSLIAFVLSPKIAEEEMAA